ncbi:MAG: hypothetical protein U1E36_02825 [Rickettsiales bacterium]
MSHEKKGFFGKVGDALTSDTAKIIGATTVGAVVGGTLPNLDYSGISGSITLPDWLTSSTTIGAVIGGGASGLITKGIVDAGNKRADTLAKQDPDYWRNYIAEQQAAGTGIPQRG